MLNGVLTPSEELLILAAKYPQPVLQASFIRKNAIPIFVGGGVFLIGFLGMILLTKM